MCIVTTSSLYVLPSDYARKRFARIDIWIKKKLWGKTYLRTNTDNKNPLLFRVWVCAFVYLYKTSSGLYTNHWKSVIKLKKQSNQQQKVDTQSFTGSLKVKTGYLFFVQCRVELPHNTQFEAIVLVHDLIECYNFAKYIHNCELISHKRNPLRGNPAIKTRERESNETKP